MSFFGRTKVPAPYLLCSSCLPLFKAFEHSFYGLLQRCGCKEEANITCNDTLLHWKRRKGKYCPPKVMTRAVATQTKTLTPTQSLEQCILQCSGFRFWVTSIWHGLQHQMLEKEPTCEAVVLLLADFFRRKHRTPLLQTTAESVGVGSFALAWFGMEEGMDVFQSVDIAQGIHVSRRRWNKLRAVFQRDSVGKRRCFSDGSAFPKLIFSWRSVRQVRQCFASTLELEHDEVSCSRSLTSLLRSVVRCRPVCAALGVQPGQATCQLDGLCGVDALPICRYGTLLPTHLCHVTAAVTALRLYINVIRISMILRCTLVQ